MAGKKNREKWKDINYRQQKVAAQARAVLKVQPEVEKVKITMVDGGVNAMRRGLFDILFNPGWMKKPVEVAIAADNSNVVKKGSPFPPHLQPFSHHTLFTAKLLKKGYQHLGSGNFSNVYGKPNSTKVLKITHNLSDSWFYYAKWANQNGWGGKYAPKMYSHKFFEQGKFAVAVMERLHPRTYEHTNPNVVVELLTRYNGNPTAERLLELVEPGLPKFIGDAKAKFRFDDDHGQNLMVRADGTLVWNDPVAWGANTANDNIKTRLRAKDLAPVALAA